jgi:hypothetical protein
LFKGGAELIFADEGDGPVDPVSSDRYFNMHDGDSLPQGTEGHKRKGGGVFFERAVDREGREVRSQELGVRS